MKEITGFPGYFVTQDGKVFSYWNRRRILDYNKKPRELKPNPVRGYLQVALYVEGKRTCKLIHRIVAETYISNPDNLATVNHINEDKTDNRVENLEWMSGADNIEYSQAKYFELKSPTGESVRVFNINKFCRENQLTASALYGVRNKKQKHHKGWVML